MCKIYLLYLLTVYELAAGAAQNRPVDTGRCVLPAYPPHGTYSYFVNNAPAAAPGQSYDSAILTVTCDAGYEVVGGNITYCFKGNNWQQPMPQCVRKDVDGLTAGACQSGQDGCVLPAYPAHGTYTAHNWAGAAPGQTYDWAILTVTCDPGYEVIGKNYTYCTSRNTWLEPMPQCVHPPKFTIRPRNLQVRANGIAAFYCVARGDPVPNIEWRKYGKRVSSMQARYLVSGVDQVTDPWAHGAVLRIEPVRAHRDDATYECVAENGIGDAVTAAATLTVFEADKVPPGFPSIAPPSSTMEVEVGHTATLPCQATGTPTPTVRWFRKSLPLELASNPRYALLNDTLGTLQIVNTEEEDQGKFECVAENSIGTEFSKPTSLYIKAPRVPQFSIPPPPRTEVMLGGNVTLKCVAIGSPLPTVKWRKVHNPNSQIPTE